MSTEFTLSFDGSPLNCLYPVEIDDKVRTMPTVSVGDKMIIMAFLPRKPNEWFNIRAVVYDFKSKRFAYVNSLISKVEPPRSANSLISRIEESDRKWNKIATYDELHDIVKDCLPELLQYFSP